MLKNSLTVSDAAVDLEKGTAAVKDVEKEEAVAIVDPLKAKLVNGFTVTQNLIPSSRPLDLLSRCLAFYLAHLFRRSRFLFAQICNSWSLFTY